MFIDIENIKKSYGEGENKFQVLKGISFEVEKGEMVVLLGPSGSGKSTLLNIIGGIDTLDSGRVGIDGEYIENMSEKERIAYRRKNLGYVFQSYNLIPNLTVRENIEVGAYLSKKHLDIEELLFVLGLKKHENKIPAQLSGGQQQRTSIGRAIIKNPNLLLCDEPTGALDSDTSKQILELIEKVKEKYNTSIIMVTHNENIAKMADTIIRLKDGSIKSIDKNIDKVKAVDLEL
ncbi:MAG: ABC transporter ATP-binding protein [Acholeplasmatales bacterium]|jgi:putative ABC transport system ATP-binding protein|nr:ABC transporter ATP-binding protein [Acholeplasmatales bacterium]MBR6287777.1 ABC transporter ATP-binding protein [Acholeplasmatales bacterium]MCR5647288.1 ABC transporter ATP-binding protein [Acholeplasmatales bacterium]